MATNDKCCTINPYFEVPEENLPKFRELSEMFVEMSNNEPGCLYYGFAYNGTTVYCREGYVDADAVLAHFANVGEKIPQILEISELARIEIHGPAEELDKLREPTKDLNPEFFVLETGFRR